MSKLVPYALKDVPNLIESGIFPVQKLSYEAQRERKAVHGQTLTTLGTYWKGRKPLILVRAIILGLLLPCTGNALQDLAMFEKLLAVDLVGLARRAFVRGLITPKHILQSKFSVSNINKYFQNSSRKPISIPNSDYMQLDEKDLKAFRWNTGISQDDKLFVIENYLNQLDSYDKKADLCKRPEEVDQDWLYDPVWSNIHTHYSKWDISANSFSELITQLGLLRFGKRPRVGDPFAGGGSIPFEAGRLGCDVSATDLNPIACMLNWGAFNIIGSSSSRRHVIQETINSVRESIQNDIDSMGYDLNLENERAKAFLYCTEVQCPQTNWLIPVSNSWVISESKSIIAKMVPNESRKSFDLKVKVNATTDEKNEARRGTVQKGIIQYNLRNRRYETPLHVIRNDYTDHNGVRKNKLRLWKKFDIAPDQSDVFTERLYAVQWFTRSRTKEKYKTYFADPTEYDLEQEQRLRNYVSSNLTDWQLQKLVPSSEIEPGSITSEPIRSRGWTHWHHLFNPRQLLFLKCLMEHSINSELPAESLVFAVRLIDWCNRGCRWKASDAVSSSLFYNQLLNP